MADDNAATQTNPAPSADGGTAGALTGGQPAAATAPAGGQAVESPSTAAGAGGETKAKGVPLPTGAFDVSKWDGEIDTAPQDVRELLQILSDKKGKQLEAGWTVKYQKLADDRKAWESERDADKAARAEIEDHLRLYKALAEGETDPRLKEYEGKVSERDAQIQTLTKERDEWKQKHDELVQASEEKWLTDFKERHKDIYADGKKTKELRALAEYGWEPDAAAELVGAAEELKKLAEETVRQNKLGPDQHKLAIQVAKQQLGIAPMPRMRRPAADITAGANGQVNPSRIPGGSLADLPLTKAVQEAASLAWKATSKQRGAAAR